MRAAVWHGARDVRLDEVAEPAPLAKGRALVEVSLAGICASDVAEYRDGPHVIPVARPHALTGRCAPIVLGHEYVGHVAAVGADVGGLTVGTRVCGDACIRCGSCYWCLRGEYNICELGGSVGLHADGAFARFVDVPAYTLFALPNEVSDRCATAVEPLAVGLHALRQAGLRPGENVVVIGYGMIGAGVAALAKSIGAGRVFVVEPNRHRARLAESMGISEVLCNPDLDLRREVRARTRVGADVVVECSGVPRLLGEAIEATRRGGRVVLCGIGHQEGTIRPSRIVYFERTIVGALGYRFDHGAVIDLLADGRLDMSPVFGEEIALSDIVGGGFERALRESSCPLRVPVVLHA
ncbi:MAG: alcohol dehydrogenase catalytic domain-containing protein [Actinomycetota bacterium]|nr:alcohol dehydrogenase catalytic domain-containing protein [Actinomycetota bacterium]